MDDNFKLKKAVFNLEKKTTVIYACNPDFNPTQF